MPLSVQKLNKQSSTNTIRQAISDSYDTCMSEKANAGESVAQHQKRCGGMIFGIVKEKTGKTMRKTG